jgi:serine protease Do
MKKRILNYVLLTFLTISVNAQEVVIIKGGIDTSEKPLMVIDGVISKNANMNEMSPNNIQSINVLKGNMATKKYGEQGSKGVIEITSKKKTGEVTVTAKEVKIDTTILDGNNDSIINKNVNLSIVIDGDKITINGKPADKNDPRLKMMGRSSMGKNGNRKKVIIEDITTEEKPEIEERAEIMEQPEMEEGSDDVMDLMAPPPPPTNAAFLGVMSEENEKGAKINIVSENSPAEKAGLLPNDIIKKVNDKKVDGPKSLYEVVGTMKPNDKITITYLRDGKELTTNATLAKNKALNERETFSYSTPNGQMPNIRRGFRISPDQNFSFNLPELKELDGLMNRNTNKPKLGISVEDIETAEGVKIKSVTAGSPAEKAGLKTNDVIIQFDENKVTDVNDLKWNYLQEGQVLKFTIQRNGEKKKIEVKIPKKLKSADL